ncbi:MAG: phosphate acyltransferase, partial [Lachnospiraceae bacterium]|nr:phosphate acyltransferase [Lachnospiraceae bacterium]
MDEMTNVAVDAMGGDNAPTEIIKGVVEAVNENSRIKVYLTGRQEDIKRELVQY